jgi:hypothetical protein
MTSLTRRAYDCLAVGASGRAIATEFKAPPGLLNASQTALTGFKSLIKTARNVSKNDKNIQNGITWYSSVQARKVVSTVVATTYEK